jgi:hypothetical protein
MPMCVHVLASCKFSIYEEIEGVEKTTKVSNIVNQSLNVWMFGVGGERTPHEVACEDELIDL